jgi:hypothetical protein
MIKETEKLELRSDLPETFKMTKQVHGVGMIQFDSSKVKVEDYPKWAKLGFADLFKSVVETVIETIIDKIEEKLEDGAEKRKAKRKSKKDKL